VKKLIIATLTLAVAVGVSAQEPKKTTQPAASASAQSADPVVIKFGTTEVRQSEFEAAVQTLPEEYQAMASGPAKRNFAEDYARMKMLAAEAVKNGLDKDAKVKMQLALMRENALASAEVDRLQKSIEITDAEIQKAYDAQKSGYEKVKARHILIAPVGSPAAPADAKLTDEQAKAKAEEIRKKLAAGGDFAELAKAESHDTGSGQRGGELGEFGRGDMVPEFDQAAFESKVGDISPVIKTQFGYHVLQVTDRKMTPVAEARPQLETEIRQRKLQERLEAMKTSAKVTFDEAFFGPAAVPPPAADAPVAPTPKQ
jgi:peptidyl-prolyl cis-trans isomerase C